MSRTEQLEKLIGALDPSELKARREWFERYDAEVWDRRMHPTRKVAIALEDLPQIVLWKNAGHSRYRRTMRTNGIPTSPKSCHCQFTREPFSGEVARAEFVRPRS